MGVNWYITERLLFQNMDQLKHYWTFVISENEVSFELSSEICTQDNKKYVIKRIPFICKDIHMLFQHRWSQEKTTHILHFNNLTYVIFWDNLNKLRPWLIGFIKSLVRQNFVQSDKI